MYKSIRSYDVLPECDIYLTQVNIDRKSTRLNSSHTVISYAVFCLKKKKTKNNYSILTLLHHMAKNKPCNNIQSPSGKINPEDLWGNNPESKMCKLMTPNTAHKLY